MQLLYLAIKTNISYYIFSHFYYSRFTSWAVSIKIFDFVSRMEIFVLWSPEFCSGHSKQTVCLSICLCVRFYCEHYGWWTIWDIVINSKLWASSSVVRPVLILSSIFQPGLPLCSWELLLYPLKNMSCRIFFLVFMFIVRSMSTCFVQIHPCKRYYILLN